MVKPYLSVLLCLFLFTCNSNKKNESSKSDASFTRYKAEKDSLFISAPWSPLTEADKQDFTGLNYFEYNPDFLFKGEIIKYSQPETTVIFATKENDVRQALKYGYFTFVYKKDEYRVQIFKMKSRNENSFNYLFLGFTDQSSGNETYSTGRYIDIEENQYNYYLIDFNYAYNPYCAYNSKYSCPIPPKENRLPFAVTAGEKIYKDH